VILRMKVSLTKHGFLKVADVLKDHPTYELTEYISGHYPGINLDQSQIKNILSFSEQVCEFPAFWDEARALNVHQLRKLVFVSYIFSHERLIDIFTQSTKDDGKGELFRSDLPNEKAYTNIVGSMSKIGLCAQSRGTSSVKYDMASLCDEELGGFVESILQIKLVEFENIDLELEDNGSINTVKTCEKYGYRKIFGLEEGEFKLWINPTV